MLRRIHAAVWLPWLLLAVDRTVRHPLGWGMPLLAVTTGLTMVSGHAATGAQMLVDVDDYRIIDSTMNEIQAYLELAYPDSVPQVRKFILGPGEPG